MTRVASDPELLAGQEKENTLWNFVPVAVSVYALKPCRGADATLLELRDFDSHRSIYGSQATPVE
jgi:hypothetical protein